VQREELVHRIQSVPAPAEPSAPLEQVVTPAEAVADLLAILDRRFGLADCSVLDLGSGTGRLAIAAALMGAHPVVGVEVDARLVPVARAAARAARAPVEFHVGEVAAWSRPADLVVMNAPFGAQRRHADRPFWDRAFALAEVGVGAFASRESRTFIARFALDRGAQVVEVEPVPWNLPRTFAHHRAAKVRLAVDRWVLATESKP